MYYNTNWLSPLIFFIIRPSYDGFSQFKISIFILVCRVHQPYSTLDGLNMIVNFVCSRLYVSETIQCIQF
jgi:hypothetical protein